MNKDMKFDIIKGIAAYAFIMVYFAIVNGGSFSSIGIKGIIIITAGCIAGTVMQILKHRK